MDFDAFDEPAPPDWFASAVADAPARGTVEVEGARIELLAWGPAGAPGLLFLHGARAHADWWSHLAPLFARDRRVASFSFSGMGRSDWRERYSFDQYLREAMAAAEGAGLFEAAEKPSLVAHSFGGYMAVLAAAEHGERLGKVVLVDSSIRPEPGASPPITSPASYPSYEAARAHFRFAPPQESEPYIADWVASHALVERDGAWTWRFDPDLRDKIEGRDVWEQLPLARCPLAFVRGERSRVVSPELAWRQQQQAPPGAPYLTIPGAHHLMADQPLALVEALSELLDG